MRNYRTLPHAHTLIVAYNKEGGEVYRWSGLSGLVNVERGIEASFFKSFTVFRVKTWVGNDYHGPELRREVIRSYQDNSKFEMFNGFSEWCPCVLDF